MTNFGVVFMNFVWILFPIIIYLIYEVYTENTNKDKSDLVLAFCLISSLYLIVRFGVFFDEYIFSIVFDLIILLFYLKKSVFNALVISIIVALYLNVNFSLYIIIFKFFVYFVFYFLFMNRKNYYILSTFLFNIFCLFAIMRNISINVIFYYLFYYFVVYFIIIFLIKAEKIIEINISYKELMKENQLRESLFKISHEIKNPIAVCKGYLDMFDTNNMSHFEKYIPIIKSEINKTLNLIQDFSACNKIKIDCDIIDISLLIEDIMDNFKLMFNDKNIDFHISLPTDEIFINGDYNRLNQVLLNIIKNSIEAIDYSKKSYINIYTKLVGKCIKIYVEDNGIGISKANMSKISEPFYTTKPNGTGLGVLLSQEIINAHDGSLDYESVEGVGTTAIITLPLYEY